MLGPQIIGGPLPCPMTKYDEIQAENARLKKELSKAKRDIREWERAYKSRFEAYIELASELRRIKNGTK